MNNAVLLTGPTSAIGKLVHENLASKGIAVIDCYSSGSKEGRAYFNLLTGENNLSLFEFDRVIHLAWVMRDRSKAAQDACQLQTKVLIDLANLRQARFDLLSTVEAKTGDSNYAFAKLSVEEALETHAGASVIRAGIIWGNGYINPLLEALHNISNFPGVCLHVVSTRQFFFSNLSALAQDIVNCQPGSRISSFGLQGFSLAEICHRLRRKQAFFHLRISFYPLAGLGKLLNQVGVCHVSLDRIAALADSYRDSSGHPFSDSRENHGSPSFMDDAS